MLTHSRRNATEKPIWIWTLIFLAAGALAIWITACGSTGEMDGDTTDTAGQTSAGPDATYTNENYDCPFQAEGELLFDITSNGDGYHNFSLIDIHTGRPAAFLIRQTGPVDFSVSTTVSPGDYQIEAETSSTWSIDIYGEATKYRCDDPLDGNNGDGGAINTDDCNCQGCCSFHGGVICAGDVTQCADGTPLSDTCSDKGCIARGCPGCE